MRRRSTVISLPGLLILVFLLSGLGFTLWRQGGLAFSPGALSSSGSSGGNIGGFDSHADFEGQCALCHQPLTSIQANQCLACHTGIGVQLLMQDSLHARFEQVEKCSQCHPDHRGKDFDLRLGSLENFDHSVLSFSLIWHQVDYSLTPMQCSACHLSDDRFSVSIDLCTTCHAGQDLAFMTTHLADFGNDCMNCHDGLDTLTRFDHANSSFPLDGSHADQTCASCHQQGQFLNLPADCVDCHSEPAIHLGVFGIECGSCHDTSSWKPALLAGESFDHFDHSGFSLELHTQDFSGDSIVCTTCHAQDVRTFEQATCNDCHALDDNDFIVQHQSQLGNNCLACHDGTDRMKGFNHQIVYPLEGRHAEIECKACHVDEVYLGTSTECKDCHLEPEVHIGFFGLKCEYCHNTSSWYPAQLVSHQFPIDHGDQGEVECTVCHLSTYSEYTCYGCHEHEVNEIADKHKDLDISTAELANCTECHLDGFVHEAKNHDE